MIIQCKLAKGGWNTNLGFISDSENCNAKSLVQEWIAEGNEPEPEFTEDEIATKEKEGLNSLAKKYLADTDWYELRAIRNPAKPAPQDVADKREAAIEQLNK